MADQQAYPGYITGPASANGVDPDLFARIAHIESGGDPSNRTGSYKGLFQLSNDEFNKYGGGDIYNPYHNANAAAAKIAAESAGFRDKYGRDPTPTDIYLTHQQGEGGYGAHMANPDAPAWVNMASTGEGRQKGAGWARQAIWGNIPDSYKRQFGSVDNVTSQDFVNMWRNKVEGGDAPMASAFAADRSGALSSTPDQGLAAIATALRGKSKMADPNQQPPSLAAQFLTGGPGALFGKPDTSEGGYNWGHALNNAAAWMQSLDTKGASLGAIKNQEDYSLVPGPDGSVYKIHKPTGKVSQISGPLPKILERGTNLFGQKLSPDVQVGTKVYRKGQLIQDYANPGATPGAGGNANVGTGNTPSVDDTDLEEVAGKIVGARETNGVTDTNELLKMLPVAAREPVRARLEGRSNVVARGLDSRMIDRLAETINPEFNAAKIKTAQETISSLSDSKKQNSYGSQRVAAEKLFNELALAAQSYDTLGPNGFKPINQPVNYVQEKLGVGNAPAQKTLAGMSNTLSEQATRVARGVGGAEADIKRQLANIGNYNENPATYYAGLQALADSILGTVHGSQAVVDEAVKAMPQEVGKHQLLTPGAEAALKHFKLRALRAQGLYSGPIPDMKTPSDTYSEQSAGRPPLSSFFK